MIELLEQAACINRTGDMTNFLYCILLLYNQSITDCKYNLCSLTLNPTLDMTYKYKILAWTPRMVKLYFETSRTLEDSTKTILGDMFCSGMCWTEGGM
jgi:hypothetical protein